MTKEEALQVIQNQLTSDMDHGSKREHSFEIEKAVTAKVRTGGTKKRPIYEDVISYDVILVHKGKRSRWNVARGYWCDIDR